MPENVTSTESRLTILLVGMLCVSIILVGTFFSAFFWMGTCGGDGGDPYVARVSPAAEACRIGNSSSLGGLLAISIMVGMALPFLALFLAIIQRKIRLLVIGSGIALVLVIVMIALPITLNRNCTEDQWASLPASDCQTYSRSSP